jgi:hypothetical protein
VKPTVGHYQAIAYVVKDQLNNGAVMVSIAEPVEIIGTYAEFETAFDTAEA